MGFTRYYQPNRAMSDGEWEAILRATRLIIEASGVTIRGPFGEGEPEFGDERLAFNGDGARGENHETMELRKDGGAWSFCKTIHKPYDLVVSAVLTAADRLAPGALGISADGGPECWLAGQVLCTALGIESRRKMADQSKAEAKAWQLKVSYAGGGVFNVASGSTKGKVYDVVLGFRAPIEEWVCSCPWSAHGGGGCAHARAVEYWLASEERDRAEAERALRAVLPVLMDAVAITAAA